MPRDVRVLLGLKCQQLASEDSGEDYGSVEGAMMDCLHDIHFLIHTPDEEGPESRQRVVDRLGLTDQQLTVVIGILSGPITAIADVE